MVHPPARFSLEIEGGGDPRGYILYYVGPHSRPQPVILEVEAPPYTPESIGARQFQRTASGMVFRVTGECKNGFKPLVSLEHEGI